uniref:Uncharacterized protein n=1 Tax=Oryza meridionalis TaxID=40149 RepID=A0A0E0EFY3_9ORYZ
MAAAGDLTDEERRALRGSKFAPLPAPTAPSRPQPRCEPSTSGRIVRHVSSFGDSSEDSDDSKDGDEAKGKDKTFQNEGEQSKKKKKKKNLKAAKDSKSQKASKKKKLKSL